MHKQESALENERHKILWDFEIQTDHPISARRSDLVLLTRKKELVEFALPVDHSEDKKQTKR